MKLVLLIDNLAKGGKERRMIELIKGLKDKSDINIDLVIFKNLIEYTEIYDLGITVHIIERKPKYNPVTLYKLYKICRKIRPDIIHAWSSMSAILAFPTIVLLNIKLVNGNIANATKNLSIWKKELLFAKFSFLFSNIIVGNSKAGLKAYGVPKMKSICIPNGFDFNRLTVIEKEEKIKNKYNVKNNYVVGKVAAFADRKDYETFIAAAHEIVKVRDDVIFFAIGDGPNFERIVNSVPVGLIDTIRFTKAISNVESVVNIFDIGVLTTNTEFHGEGISNSILEYMALSKPVIATTGGGTNEIVIDRVSGYLIPQKSASDLANKILELLDNPEKAKQMGAAGRKRIVQDFNLKKMTAAYMAIYNKLIDAEN